MRIHLWCLLLCLACDACATAADRCQGSLEQINQTQALKKSTTPPDGAIP